MGWASSDTEDSTLADGRQSGNRLPHLAAGLNDKKEAPQAKVWRRCEGAVECALEEEVMAFRPALSGCRPQPIRLAQEYDPSFFPQPSFCRPVAADRTQASHQEHTI